jgi:lipopolysaccharide export LptBFGC system permease protein LptF
MKRWILTLSMTLALLASMSYGFASTRSASAYLEVSPCVGYGLGYWYYKTNGQPDIAEQWWNEGNSYGCDFQSSWNNAW